MDKCPMCLEHRPLHDGGLCAGCHYEIEIEDLEHRDTARPMSPELYGANVQRIETDYRSRLAVDKYEASQDHEREVRIACR